jgi:peptide deformylase
VAILDIRVLGDPILRQATTPVAEITDSIKRLIDDMFQTMHHARGIGLAAPQVGRTERLTVVDVDGEQIVLINPEIILSSSAKSKGEEGCLSIPDIYADVERPKTVTVRALDRNGQPFERETADLLARCLQHEIDHLDGKLFLDYLSVLKRTAALAKWRLTSDDYPGYVRRVALETPDDLSEHEHPEEEL